MTMDAALAVAFWACVAILTLAVHRQVWIGRRWREHPAPSLLMRSGARPFDELAQLTRHAHRRSAGLQDDPFDSPSRFRTWYTLRGRPGAYITGARRRVVVDCVRNYQWPEEDDE